MPLNVSNERPVPLRSDLGYLRLCHVRFGELHGRRTGRGFRYASRVERNGSFSCVMCELAGREFLRPAARHVFTAAVPARLPTRTCNPHLPLASRRERIIQPPGRQRPVTRTARARLRRQVSCRDGLSGRWSGSWSWFGAVLPRTSDGNKKPTAVGQRWVCEESCFGVRTSSHRAGHEPKRQHEAARGTS